MQRKNPTLDLSLRAHFGAAGALMLALGVTGCGSESSGGETGDGTEAEAPISQADLVDPDDLLLVEDDASGAIKKGDAAWVLIEARKRAKGDVELIKSALHSLKIAATSAEPTKKLKLNKASYAMWQGEKDGHVFRLHVFRIDGKRLRYTMTAQAGGKGAFKPLFTGIFVKKGDRKGGGRLHIDLDNCAAVGGAAATGKIHVWFANHQDAKIGRRIVYRNVKLKDADGPAWNYGADYIHKFGVGGRYRTVLIGDIDPKLPGIELLALRLRWSLGLGGRADGVYAHVAPPPVKKLATLHECWDAKGLRSAYKDDYAGNDAENPDEGDVSKCSDFAMETPPDTVADVSGSDADPELDALLTEAEAAGIAEADADKVELAE